MYGSEKEGWWACEWKCARIHTNVFESNEDLTLTHEYADEKKSLEWMMTYLPSQPACHWEHMTLTLLVHDQERPPPLQSTHAHTPALRLLLHPLQPERHQSFSNFQTALDGMMDPLCTQWVEAQDPSTLFLLVSFGGFVFSCISTQGHLPLLEVAKQYSCPTFRLLLTPLENESSSLLESPSPLTRSEYPSRILQKKKKKKN